MPRVPNRQLGEAPARQETVTAKQGTTVQNDFETVTKHYLVDYLSVANRDILVTEDGSYIQRYVYDESGTRISGEFSYADGAARGTVNAAGEYGENLQSDFAAQDIQKVYYRANLLGSSVFAVDRDGGVIYHTVYDPWGSAQTDTYPDANYSGLDNANNFTGYTWDEVLNLYFAQNRFYSPETHRFTQEDIVKDGGNWYVYCENRPADAVDSLGFMPVKVLRKIEMLYLCGAIPDDYIGSIVIAANAASLATDYVQRIHDIVTLDFRAIYDMVTEVEDELKDPNPSKQAIYVAFHETAQIVAAKQIAEKYGGVPMLEDLFKFGKEADITLGDYVWEVKPGYVRTSVYTASLKKYVDDYSIGKDVTEYAASKGWKIPGDAFASKTVNLFQYNNICVNMDVKYLGPGKIGYFFQIGCDNEAYEEAYAKDIVSVLLPVFQDAENLNTLTEIASELIILFAAAASPVPGDEEVAFSVLADSVAQLGFA